MNLMILTLIGTLLLSPSVFAQDKNIRPVSGAHTDAMGPNTDTCDCDKFGKGILSHQARTYDSAMPNAGPGQNPAIRQNGADGVQEPL